MVYEPSQALTDTIILRDRYCRFPGCHRKANISELDHITPYNGTNTIETNLHALCCRHHHGKHDHGWTPTRHPDGTTEWTSPTGRNFVKPPDDYPGAPLEAPPQTDWTDTTFDGLKADATPSRGCLSMGHV